MGEEYSYKYSNRFMLYHRVMYVALFVALLIERLAKVYVSNLFFIYYTVLLIIISVADIILLNKKYIFNCRYFDFKCIFEVFFLSVGCYVLHKFDISYLLILMIQMVSLFELDTFNKATFESQVSARRLLGVVLVAIGFFSFKINDIGVEWIIIFLMCTVSLYFALSIISEHYIKSVQDRNERYKALTYEMEKMNEDKEKLIEYQEKVKQVNLEINRQKFALTNANQELEKANNEMLALVDIMKSFSSDFDVLKAMRILTHKIPQIKNVDMCAFYISADTFQNKTAQISIFSNDAETKQAFFETLPLVYELLEARGDVSPVSLSKNTNMAYTFLGNTKLCDAIALPAYENGNIYGVLVIGSVEEDFFKSGYAFYESALIDFSSVLTSTKLFLQMEEMANNDALTKVNNRLYFNRQFPGLAKHAVENNSKLSVAIFDIDKFKVFNDTYGHLAGDEVLKMVGHTDTEFAKENDGYAIRYGGEEFLLILPGKGVDESVKILEQFHEKIKNTVVTYGDYALKVDISIGLSVYPETCSDINKIVVLADKAMYFSKNNGRGMLVVSGREEESLARHLELTDPEHGSDKSINEETPGLFVGEINNDNETEDDAKKGDAVIIIDDKNNEDNVNSADDVNSADNLNSADNEN